MPLGGMREGADDERVKKEGIMSRLVKAWIIPFALAIVVSFPTLLYVQHVYGQWQTFRHDTQHTERSVFPGSPREVLAWSCSTGSGVSSSPAIGSYGRVCVESNDSMLSVFEGPPTPTQTPTGPPTPTPAATPLLNYVSLGALPTEVTPGGEVEMAWRCDFSTWNYRGVRVDVYVAVIRNPRVIGEPSSVSDALAGGAVYLYGPDMKGVYQYNGKVGEPSLSNVAFPPAPTFGTLMLKIPTGSAYRGDYVFATAFIRRTTRTFVRADGKPVENSNLFMIRTPLPPPATPTETPSPAPTAPPAETPTYTPTDTPAITPTPTITPPPTTRSDIDGDGWKDRDEVLWGTDPFDRESYPSPDIFIFLPEEYDYV